MDKVVSLSEYRDKKEKEREAETSTELLWDNDVDAVEELFEQHDHFASNAVMSAIDTYMGVISTRAELFASRMRVDLDKVTLRITTSINDVGFSEITVTPDVDFKIALALISIPDTERVPFAMFAQQALYPEEYATFIYLPLLIIQHLEQEGFVCWSIECNASVITGVLVSTVDNATVNVKIDIPKMREYYGSQI